MSLDTLPVELLAHILRSVDSPDQLDSLISASPSCFRVFSQSADIILSSLIKDVAHPIVLHELLAVWNAPIYTEGDELKFRHQLDSFFAEYSKPGSFDFPNKKEDLKAIYRFIRRVNSVVDDYFNHSMLKLRNAPLYPMYDPSEDESDDGKDPNEVDIPTSPSRTERARMQRAFLRFELYCRTFPACKLRPHGSIVSAHEQFQLFLISRTAWEVEEITCVHQYYSTIIQDSINQFEDQFVEAVLAAPGVVLPQQPPSSNERQICGTADSDLVSVQNLSSGNLCIFSQDERVNFSVYLGYMASMGINFIYQLTHADNMSRAGMIRKHCPGTRDFLAEALMTAPRRYPFATRHYYIDDEDLSRGNEGYYSFRTSEVESYLSILYSGVMNLKLREMGYVFWDSIRFDDPLISGRFQRAQSITKEDMFERLMGGVDGGAEQKLKDVWIPRGEMDRIRGEFGSERDTRTVRRLA